MGYSRFSPARPDNLAPITTKQKLSPDGKVKGLPSKPGRESEHMASKNRIFISFAIEDKCLHR